MKCAALILHHNNQQLLPPLLDSLSGQQRLDSIVVIDNASTDNSVSYLREQHPGVEIIENKENLNFGTAYNRAIATRSEDVILILNNDVIVHPGSVMAAIQFLEENNDVASVSFEGLDPKRGNTPFPCDPCQPLRTFGKILSPGRAFQSRSDAPVESPCYLWGAACAVRRDVFEQVRFDEDMSWYFEDIDLGWSIRRRTGMRNVFHPSSTIYHLESTTSLSRFKKRKIRSMSGRNALISFSKNGSVKDWFRGAPRMTFAFLRSEKRRELFGLIASNVYRRIIKSRF